MMHQFPPAFLLLFAIFPILTSCAERAHNDAGNPQNSPPNTTEMIPAEYKGPFVEKMSGEYAGIFVGSDNELPAFKIGDVFCHLVPAELNFNPALPASKEQAAGVNALVKVEYSSIVRRGNQLGMSDRLWSILDSNGKVIRDDKATLLDKVRALRRAGHLMMDPLAEFDCESLQSTNDITEAALLTMTKLDAMALIVEVAKIGAVDVHKAMKEQCGKIDDKTLPLDDRMKAYNNVVQLSKAFKVYCHHKISDKDFETILRGKYPDGSNELLLESKVRLAIDLEKNDSLLGDLAKRLNVPQMAHEDVVACANAIGRYELVSSVGRVPKKDSTQIVLAALEIPPKKVFVIDGYVQKKKRNGRNVIAVYSISLKP